MSPIDRLIEFVGRFPPDAPASLFFGVTICAGSIAIRVECA
jgi:hypothetical protein